MSLRNDNELITTSYMWDIQNFSSIIMLSEPGYRLTSPLFNLRSINRKWQFHLYPNGRLDKDYIAFYLSKMHNSNQGVYNFTLSIGRPDAAPVESYEYRDQSFEGRVVGKEHFLCKKSNRWILRGPVRFRCDITEVGLKNLKSTIASFSSSDPLNADTTNLSLELEKLLNDPFRSDLTVNISGNVIYIHKYMLYARCQNISYAFGYRTVMEMPSSVETEINVKIFELLMYYVYTGKLRDSHVSLELFQCAERLGIASLLQCVHEQAGSAQYYSEVEIEKKIISWNLDELKFLEKGSTCVHILRTTLYAKHLAIQLSISEGCEKEKFINVSFKFFGVYEGSAVALISKISLTSEDGLEIFKEEQHVFVEDEQWNFPRLLCQGHKKYSSKVGACLTAELSMFDKLSLREKKGIKTKTKLQTKVQTVTENLDDLRGSMSYLHQMAKSTGNFVLVSKEGRSFRVHDGIVWARWPGVKKMLDEDSDTSDREANDSLNLLKLSLPSDVLNTLLSYLYSGFLGYLDRETAELFLKYSSEVEFPPPLVEKCLAILSVNQGNHP